MKLARIALMMGTLTVVACSNGTSSSSSATSAPAAASAASATGASGWTNTIPVGNITAAGGVRNTTDVSAILSSPEPGTLVGLVDGLVDDG